MAGSCPVVVATCRGEISRHAVFDEHLARLIRPAGSRITQPRGPSIAQARNVAIDAALDCGAERIMFIDDDHAFAPDALLKLLERDVDVVSGTYLQRKWPFHVCAFSEWLPAEPGMKPKGLPFCLRPGIHGLQPIVCAGAGALLIKMSVFEQLERPYFSLAYNYPDTIAEDFTFFYQLNYQKGIPVWLDTDVVFGHYNEIPIWPIRENNEWMTIFASGDEAIPIPSALGLLRGKQVESSPIILPK